MQLVDKTTQQALLKARDCAEIHQVLDGGSVVWQEKALCLRHPMKPGGCDLPVGSDLATCPRSSPWLELRTSQA